VLARKGPLRRAEWQIKDEVRRLVRFQSFDLRSPMASLGAFERRAFDTAYFYQKRWPRHPQ
jgi:hypothetical protein